MMRKARQQYTLVYPMLMLSGSKDLKKLTSEPLMRITLPMPPPMDLLYQLWYSRSVQCRILYFKGRQTYQAWLQKRVCDLILYFASWTLPKSLADKGSDRVIISFSFSDVKPNLYMLRSIGQTGKMWLIAIRRLWNGFLILWIMEDAPYHHSASVGLILLLENSRNNAKADGDYLRCGKFSFHWVPLVQVP